MARLFVVGSSEALERSGWIASLDDFPLSFFCNAALVSTTANTGFGLLSISGRDSSFNGYHWLLSLHNGPATVNTFLRAAITDNTGASTVESSNSFLAPMSARKPCLAVFHSTTEVSIYFDGTKTTDAALTARDPSGATDAKTSSIGRIGIFATTHHDGPIDTVALWAGALDDDESADLMAGYAPESIRPDLLRVNLPVWGKESPEVDDWSQESFPLVNTPLYTPHTASVIYPGMGLRWSLPSSAGGDVTFAASLTVDADHVAALEVDRNLAANLTVDAEHVAALTVDRLLAANLTADADFVSLLTVDRLLAASLTVDAEHVAALEVDRLLAASLTVDAEHVAALTVDRLLAASLTVDAEFAAALTVDIDNEVTFAANLTADADFVSLLTVDRLLVASFTADADFAAALEVDRLLAASLTVDADHTAALEVDRLLAANLTADANFAAALEVGVIFAAALTVDADHTAALEVDRLLAASFTADADFVSVLTVDRLMAVSLTSDANFVAALTVVPAIPATHTGPTWTLETLRTWTFETVRTWTPGPTPRTWTMEG